jgi:two-component system, NtrC family, sensor kinase
MPGLSGIELLRKIIVDYPNTVVIVVSGVDRPQRALDAMRLGAFDYIIKPCDPEVLEITVERAIKHRTLLLDSHRYKLELETKNEELLNRKVQLEYFQTQIVQSEKMASLGQLSAGVAHELNNPVGYVHANLEILGQYVDDLIRLVSFYDENATSPTAESDASIIKQQIGYPAILKDINSIVRDCREGSDRIRDIVQNLRTFSRLDEAAYKETNVHEGIDATTRLLSRHFSSGNITLIREYGDLPLVGTFSGQLNQVWMNLLVNAAQAIGNGNGFVKIVTRADVDSIFVEVTDTGCGIAVQHLKHIFDPFYTTKPVGEGTGLGLSISFGIIQRHGGSISVETKLNEGTTFKVRLPRVFQSEMIPDEKSIMFYKEI